MPGIIDEIFGEKMTGQGAKSIGVAERNLVDYLLNTIS
jgi:hypothetical protein